MNEIEKTSLIKKTVKSEILERRNDSLRHSANCINSAMIREGYESLISRLEACNTTDKLDKFIFDVYKMSLSEWIQSL